jgi:hypothetical protein
VEVPGANEALARRPLPERPTLTTPRRLRSPTPTAAPRAPLAGLISTLLVIVAAVALAMLGQLVLGGVDLRGIFEPSPGAGHVPTFPATMPLAAAVFGAGVILHVAIGRRWPFGRDEAEREGGA